MPEFAAVSFAIRVVYLLVTLLIVVIFLRWFDRSIGINFRKDVWNVLAENPVALALYHGLRFVGVLYLAGQFLS